MSFLKAARRRPTSSKCFAAGERGGRLAETKVAQADLVEDGKLVDDLGVAGKEGHSFADSQVEHVEDGLPLYLTSSTAAL